MTNVYLLSIYMLYSKWYYGACLIFVFIFVFSSFFWWIQRFNLNGLMLAVVAGFFFDNINMTFFEWFLPLLSFFFFFGYIIFIGILVCIIWSIHWKNGKNLVFSCFSFSFTDELNVFVVEKILRNQIDKNFVCFFLKDLKNFAKKNWFLKLKKKKTR